MNEENYNDFKNFFKYTKEIKELTPLPKNFDTKHLQDFIQDFINEFESVRQENARLKDNWNSLKDIAKSQSELKQQCRNGSLWFEIDELLNKMKEIEEN